MAALLLTSSPGLRAEEMAPLDEGQGWESRAHLRLSSRAIFLMSLPSGRMWLWMAHLWLASACGGGAACWELAV